MDKDEKYKVFREWLYLKKYLENFITEKYVDGWSIFYFCVL